MRAANTFCTNSGGQVYSTLESMPSHLKTKLEKFAYSYGNYYDSYLVVDGGREYFWTHDLTGAVGFARRGRYLNIVGGLLAADERKTNLLLELRAYADKENLVLSIFPTSFVDVPYFKDLDFQLNKYGEDAIIELKDLSWGGKKFDWVRRQANFAKRAGIKISELKRDEVTEDVWQATIAELSALNQAIIATKPQGSEMLVVEGRIDSDCMHRRRIFIARDGDGIKDIQGFILCNPYRDGKSWAIEIYRYRLTAPRGVVPALIKHTLDLFKEEQIQDVSLCLIPALGASERVEGGNKIARWALMFWERHLNFIFDTRGLFHFKSRFRPEFRRMYICVYPKATPLSILAFMSVLGVLNLNLKSVRQTVVEKLAKTSVRANLARPELSSKTGK